MQRIVRVRVKVLLRRVKRFVFYTILHADDPPERLARGVAVGMFFTFTPTVGFQSALVILFSWILRANKLVGLPVVWITNPVTIIPIYYICYVIGALIWKQEPVGFEWMKQLLADPPELLADPPAGIWSKWTYYWNQLEPILMQLWTGCLVVSTALGLLSYFVTVSFVRTYRRKHLGRVFPRAIHKLTHIHQHNDPDKQGNHESNS